FANASLPLLLLGVLLAALSGRLAWLQLARHDVYAEEVDRAVIVRHHLAAPRGRILDARGAALADVRARVRCTADPAELAKAEAIAVARAVKRDPSASPEATRKRLRHELLVDLATSLKSTAGAVGGSLDARVRDLEQRLARREGESRYVVLANDVSTEEEIDARAALARHRHGGAISFEEDFDRVYPAGASVAPLVGFFGSRPKHTDPGGVDGIELEFDSPLRGTSGSEAALRAPLVRGRELDLDEERPATPGASIRLTVDSTISAIVHEECRRAIEEFPSKFVAAVVLEAKTGRVLAIHSIPAFDPNAAPGAPNVPLANQAIVTAYEPGSSIKPFTVAAALDAGAIGLEDRFPLHGGTWWIPGRKKPIQDTHFDPAHGVQDAGEILRRSSNVGAVTIGQRAGAATIASAFARFGFEEKTGIELPGELRCKLPSRARTWDVPNTLSSVSFGYQFMVTPLRLAAAYAMLANGGVRVEPRVVDSVVRADGQVWRPSAPPAARVLREGTARSVRELLLGTVNEEGGTAFERSKALRAEFPEIALFAGKTGTAVIHHRPGRLNGTFACFGPMPEPALVVLVVAADPDRVRYGGDVCVRPGLRILARSLRALGLTPPGPAEVELASVGSPPVRRPISLARATPEAR
ncbi:MAG TPA: penicillin-binding protein 2, partial [Planctomycetota bacterium]|nr:penicillin-binding protein 2 [Planctomycetota bacterium]